MSDHVLVPATQLAPRRKFQWRDLPANEDLTKKFLNLRGELRHVAIAKGEKWAFGISGLRLKDTTDVYAPSAELAPLASAAQVRDHLLRAAGPFSPNWTAQKQYADAAGRFKLLLQ